MTFPQDIIEGRTREQLSKENSQLAEQNRHLLNVLLAVYSTVVYPACSKCNSQFAVDGNTARLMRATLDKYTIA